MVMDDGDDIDGVLVMVVMDDGDDHGEDMMIQDGADMKIVYSVPSTVLNALYAEFT